MTACPACHTSNSSDTVFCRGCGAPLRASDAAATAVAPAETVLIDHPEATRAPATPRPADAVGGRALVPGQTFGTRYHVIRELGAGGMGAVYQAWDAELGVAVALKIIRGDLVGGAQDAERRFKRELLLARKVTHKHVVRIHDLGEVEGVKYITMPYIEGIDLGRLLEKEGRLPVARVIAIGRQIAGGLEAAHEVGVVHRDLKPANVMIDGEDTALIMDFGIARSVAPGATSATVAGSVMGTFQYMAPEQARGEPVDHRADIYAFGLMLRDMLVGLRVEDAANPVAALMARLQQALPSVRSIDPAIPEPVDAIVTRCLERDPAARYQRTSEVVADLEAVRTGIVKAIAPAVARPRQSVWMPAAAAAAIVVMTGTAWWMARSQTDLRSAAPQPVSVLIADFVNKTADPVFEGALEQALSLGIEGASFITSYPRQSAQQVALQITPGRRLDEEMARLVSAREGIKVVLAGSVARSGGEYEISVRALDAAVGTTLATAAVTADDKPGVLAAINDLATDIRRALGDTQPESGALQAKETFTAGSLEAARAYVQGQELLAQGKEKDAIGLFQQALGHDPDMGRAYASWAVAAYRLGNRGEAEGQWKKALALMDRMTERERFRTLGTYYFGVTRNYDLAVQNYEALLQRYPADSAGLTNLGFAYFETLNFPKAVEQGRRAVAVYPKNALARQNLSLYLMYSNDLGAAVAEAKQVLALNPSFHKAYLPLAVAALVAGDRQRARAAYDDMARTGPRGASLATLGRVDLALYEGRWQEAETMLRDDLAAAASAASVRDRALRESVLAETLAAAGRLQHAAEAARAALKLGDFDDVAVPAAQVLVAAGFAREAAAMASAMDQKLQKRTRALGKLIQAEIAAQRGQTVQAVDLLTEAKALADLWPVRFAMGRVLAEAGQYADALADLDACAARAGEAGAPFLTDVPSYRSMVPVHYWRARAQDALGMSRAAADNYRAYLAVRGELPADRLAADARKRLAPSGVRPGSE